MQAIQGAVTAYAIRKIVEALSQPVRGIIEDGMKKAYQKAIDSSSPLDDVVMKFLCDAMGVDVKTIPDGAPVNGKPSEIVKPK